MRLTNGCSEPRGSVAVAIVASGDDHFDEAPFVGLPLKQIVGGMAAIAFVSIFAAELFGRVQEFFVLHTYGLTPDRPLYINRWWPFEHHEIA